MTDQIYYKLQYPLKKAIDKIKKVDSTDPFAGKEIDEMSSYELNKLKEFIDMWEEEGKDDLKKVIKSLREIQ